MDLTERITGHFGASIAAKQATLDSAAPAIVAAATTMARVLNEGGKILCCGNGGSAADAQHFASELVNRFEINRRGLPAVALTTDSSILTSIANDDDFSQIFARPVLALARSGDLLLALSTSGNSDNVNRAIEAAHESGMTVVALTGRDGGQLLQYLAADDIEIRASSDSTARIQEVHELVLHCLCDLIDYQLFASTTST